MTAQAQRPGGPGGPGAQRRRLSLQVVPTPRFRLPADPARPVVMFAAGSGVAPFLGFVAARARSAGGSGEDLLYLGARGPEAFVEHADLDAAAAAGRLRLHVAFSRADAAVRFDAEAGRHVVVPAPSGGRRRVDDVLRSPEHADRLWDLLRPRADGGGGAHVRVCGSATFSAAVLEALTDVARRGTGSERAAREFVRDLSAQGRLGQDVFTTYLGHAQQGPRVEVSELALRNTPEAGFWMAVDGRVHDVSELLHTHVGGPHVLRNHTGVDATAAYRTVLHHAHAEIDAQLGLYAVGHLRRLAFGGRWGVVLTEDGLRSLPLEELFTTWVRTVHLVVGMENALAADYSFTTTAATRGEDPRELTPFKAQFVVQAHRRFLVSHLDGFVDDDLRTLWQLTAGFCDPRADVREHDDRRAAAAAGEDHRLVRGCVAQVAAQVEGGRGSASTDALCRGWVRADAAALRALKEALLVGVRAFEEHEADVVERAGSQLLGAVRAALDVVDGYDARMAALSREHGFTEVPDGGAQGSAVPPVPPDRGVPGHGGPLGGLTSPR